MYWKSCGAVLIIAFTTNAFAQFFRVDPAFPSSLDGPVYALQTQPDGKILIGGAFTSVNGIPRPRLARLNGDGTLDETFAVTGETLEKPIVRLGYRDLKVFAYVYSQGTHRYTASGNFELTYNHGGPFVVDSYGRAIFGSVNENLYWDRLMRFNGDGTRDSSFSLFMGCCHNMGVSTLAIQTDSGAEKLLIGGNFTEIGTNRLSRLGLLNEDGSVDTSFVGRSTEEILDLKPWREGKFYTASDRSIERRFADGSFDSGFTSVKGRSYDHFYTITPDHNGNVILLAASGTFVLHPLIARFHSDGTKDTNFSVVVSKWPHALAMQPDGTIILAGSFTNVNCISRAFLTRLIPSDTPDPLPCVPPPPVPDPQPPLYVARLRGAKMVCCWPTNYPEHTLQATRRLRPNHPEKEKWFTVTNTPVASEGTVCVTNRIARWGRHYRLVKE